MCGIVGLINRRGPVDADALQKARDALVHRGPDDAGIWIDTERGVGLAHRRLSIIDLSAKGHQPMANEDGSLILVYNGEIYNFQVLRLELQQLGHSFVSSSDTEVILHAYEEWGLDAIQKLNGMFAFALYDRKGGQLVLARDRFGEKPLYYADTGSVFAFASELKALAALPGIELQMDSKILQSYLMFGNVPYPASAFRGICKLPPAQNLIFETDTGRARTRCYWDMADAFSATEPEAKGDDLVERLETLVTDAVRLRLVADVPIGAFLSGGVDSSLIVAIMSRLQAQVKTFSIGFEEGIYDEVPHARAVADYLGSDHHEYYVTPRESLDLLLELPAMYDEPFADSSAIPTYIVSRFAREQVTVALTGDGGDELFGGYTTYPWFALLGPLLRVPALLRRGAASVLGALGSGRLKRHAPLLRIDEAWDLFLYLNERTIAKRFDVDQVIVHSQGPPLVASTFYRKFEAVRPRGDLQAALYAEAQTYLVDDILTKVDRASMAVSLETRVPLLDSSIAEFATALPMRAKMGTWRLQKKKLLRALLGRYVPLEMFDRPKHGFAVPLHTWFRGELKWLLREYLDKSRLEREGLFDARFVGEIVDEHLSGCRNREALLWSLVFWQLWREEWNV